MTCRHGKGGHILDAHFASRRGVIAALACVAALPASPVFAVSDIAADDERFMRLALEEAKQGDAPFGTVIVRDGQLLARGHNLARTTGDPTAHGEMVAIRRCVADHGGAALRGSTLYTTGEPCVMCMGAILWSRFARMVFAASVQQLAATRDQIMISTADIAGKAPFVSIAITGGVLADEALLLFAQSPRPR